MPKKQFSPIDDAEKLRPIFDGFFKAYFEDQFEEKIVRLRLAIDKQDSKSFQIMIGVVVVCLLFIGGLIWDSHTFRTSYNEGFLDAKESVKEEVAGLRQENEEIKKELLEKVETTSEEQDYIEKLLLERNLIR